MSDERSGRLGLAAGLVVAAGVVALVLSSRGGATYDLSFGTAFSDSKGFALIAAAVIAAVLLAGAWWAAALLVSFAVLAAVLGVVHPCRIAFQDTPSPDRCSVSASASALGLYVPLSACGCAVARLLASRVALTAATSAKLLGVSGAGVLVSLWLPWYSAPRERGGYYTDTGWQVFQRFDVYLIVVAAVAGMLAVAILLGRARRADRLASAVALLALSGAGVVFYRLFTAADRPSSGHIPLAAAYVALGALIAVAFACFAVMQAGTHPRR